MKQRARRGNARRAAAGARWLAGWFVLDRALKAAAIAHFFRQPAPAATDLPDIAMIQPITRGATALADNLASRLGQEYPAIVRHVWILDRADAASQAICAGLRAAHPNHPIAIVAIDPDVGAVATKIAKMRAGLAAIKGDPAGALVFIDDDVALAPDALRRFLPYLGAPRAGAIFGLARYVNWTTIWSSAMSAFVNANALPSYVPLSYLTEPYTITGHFFAMRRAVFESIGGLEGLPGRVDDDHVLARRLRARGLRSLQTPLIYAVDNHLASAGAYAAQMRRWFVFPRWFIMPYLSRRERLMTGAGGAANIAPPLLLLCAALRWRESGGRRALAPLGLALAVHAALYRWMERYAGRTTPLRRWPLVVLGALADPLLILHGLTAGREVRWRGQRLRVATDQPIEVIE